jgi:hypothetical protein
MGLGVSIESASRFLDGDEIEGDYITARDHDIVDQINARKKAERALETERAAVSYRDKIIANMAEQLATETAARKEAERKLDALTVWQDNNCDVPGSPLVQQRHRATGKIEVVSAVHMRASQDNCVLYTWRHTPESIAAAEKGGDNDGTT